MLALVKRSFASKYTAYWFWGIALLALTVEAVFHALLPISISNDTYGYLQFSQKLINPDVAFERSVGYPLFLALLGTNLFDSLMPVILMQAAIAVAIPLFAFNSLLRFGMGYAVLGALVSCAYFYNFVVSMSILTEPVYVFTTALYAFFLIRYFTHATVWNLLAVIACCWLIALVRVSGTLYFLSVLTGIGLYIIINGLQRNGELVKTGIRHLAIALAVFFSISLFQHAISNRTSSVIWPHFVFNWAYKDSSVSPIYLGIIKPENGPATQKLFDAIEKIVTENPEAFDMLKAGGTEQVKALMPGKNKKYAPEAVKLLMNDLINNNKHDLRSWWIEGVLNNYGFGVVGTSKILGDAILESFKKHPEALLNRAIIVLRDRILFNIRYGIEGNIVSLPTAYHHQIPRIINTPPPEVLKPDIYSQWAYDLFRHTGNAAVDRDVYSPKRYPKDLSTAQENIKSDNLIGFGHYIAVLGTQVIRLCWLLVALGVVILPFARHKPLLASLICASIIPPSVSVFISETDGRHLLMSSPVHIATAILVLYLLVDLIKAMRGKWSGQYA